MVAGVRTGGNVLDLPVIRPHPRVEVDGDLVCVIDGEPLLRQADAAAAAIDRLVRRGRLVEEAVDDHDVLKHYPNGADVVADFEDSEREIPAAAIPALQAL